MKIDEYTSEVFTMFRDTLLYRQYKELVTGLMAGKDPNDDVHMHELVASKKQARLAITPLNVMGTAQEYHCDPQQCDNGLDLCLMHYTDCGGATSFRHYWNRLHAVFRNIKTGS